MVKSLAQKTIYGMIWNAVERFGSSLLLFISNLVLARLLSPKDFGCVGMLMVFISLSDAIVDGGFGSALIQKKEPTQTDYSTIFYWNIVLSVVLYIVLCFTAPFIASFYEIPLLSDVLKVQGLVLVFNAFTLIQRNMLQKRVAFKRIAKINLLAVSTGTALAIVLAFFGWGVWSLVVKVVSTAVISCFIYWMIPIWKPMWIFSWQSFRELFRFGGFMFLISAAISICSNLIQLVIGKISSITTLGYYSQAMKMEDLPRNSFSGVVSNVIFPIFSSIQDDLQRVKAAAKKCTKAISYVNFALMTLFIVIARPLFLILFTDKWEESIPYFQILCLAGIVLTFFELNCLFFRSLGKSKTNLKIVLIRSILTIVLTLCGIPWQIYGILYGFVLANIIAYIVSAIYLNKLLHYGLHEQLKDNLPILFLSIVVGVLSYIPSLYITNSVLLLFVQCVSFATLFLSLSILFKLDAFKLYHQIIKIKLNE